MGSRSCVCVYRCRDSELVPPLSLSSVSSGQSLNPDLLSSTLSLSLPAAVCVCVKHARFII